MKKALGILSVLVLITVMLVSCNAEQNVNDTVEVSFNVSSSRTLTVKNDDFISVNSDKLTWYYHGEKKTDTGFITGQSESMNKNHEKYWTKISKGNELASTKVTFSQGQWYFEVKAMKGNTQMYYGVSNGNVLLTKENRTISISVSPFVSGAKGTLKIDSVYIDPKDSGSENVAPNRLLINGVLKDISIPEGSTSLSYTEQVEPGTYTVEVQRVGEEDTGVILASASKTVVVYSGLTTTIKGSVEEDTTTGTFDPQPIKPEGKETVTVPTTGKAVVEFVNVTPSMEADKSTKVTIPSAVVTSETRAVTLDIVVKDSESVADNSFNVTTNYGVAASISLTMKNDGQAITNFGSNKVTVETYIETGLSGVKVKYNGQDGDPSESDIEYVPATGKLTFKTTHFSEFYVEAEKQAKIGDEEYLTLQKAFDAAEDGDTVILLVNVDPTQTLVVSKRITLDLNGGTITNTNDIWDDATADWSLISVRGGDLTVNGNGSLISKDNDCFALDIQDGGNLVIKNGTYVGNISAVYAYEGTLLIEGGEYSIIQQSNISGKPYEFLLNCYDANRINDTASIVVSGGKFHKFNPANCKAEGDGTNFMREWFSTKNIGTEDDPIYEACSAYECAEIKIYSSEGLLEFARLVNEEGKTFEGKTVKLMADIDLADVDWTPVGTNADGANKFKGTFDGNYKTISNMTIDQNADYHAAGFFGALNGTAKNIVFDNANVSSVSSPASGGITDNGTAVVAGSIYTSGSIEGVTVKNSTVSGNRYVGGISGYTYGSVKNCTVEKTTITTTPDNLTGAYDNGDKAGGIVGAFWHENAYEVSGNTVKDVTVTGYRDIGGIVGYANGNVTSNTVNGLTLIQDYSILSTPRTTVEAIIGRHDGFAVDASNGFSDVNFVVEALDQLKRAVKFNGSNIIIKCNIALEEPITIDGDNITLKGDGNYTISGYPVNVKTTSNVTFENVNFATPDNIKHNASSVYASGLEGKVVFDDCTFTNPQWECIQITPMDGAEIVVKNCTFIVDGKGIYAKENGTKVERMLHIQNTDATGMYTATITNNRFIGVDLCRNSVIDIDDIAAFANVTCGGNTFANHDGTDVSTLADGKIYININGKYDAANVATETYAQFTQSPAAALHP